MFFKLLVGDENILGELCVKVAQFLGFYFAIAIGIDKFEVDFIVFLTNEAAHLSC